MKKNFPVLFIFALLFVPNFFAQDRALSKSYQFESFAEAEVSEEFIYFELASTKVGFITTYPRGYAKRFSLSATIRGEEVADATINIPVSELDSDSSLRDEKMRDETLSAKESDAIEVRFTEPFFLQQLGEREIDAKILIRGNWKDIRVKFDLQKENDAYLLTGSSPLSIKELELPSPSIFVASVADLFWVRFHFKIQASEIK